VRVPQTGQMKIERGNVTIWYSNWKGNHSYRGKLDPTGKIDAWHTNGEDLALFCWARLETPDLPAYVPRSVLLRRNLRTAGGAGRSPAR